MNNASFSVIVYTQSVRHQLLRAFLAAFWIFEAALSVKDTVSYHLQCFFEFGDRSQFWMEAEMLIISTLCKIK